MRQAPEDLQFIGNLAGILKELARPDEAEAMYREVLRRHPDMPRHMSILAIVC